MSDAPARRKVDLTQAALTAFAALALGGGGGSFVTAQGLSAELRETRAVFTGRFDRLDQRNDETMREQLRTSNILTDHERRIQAGEIWRAQADARSDARNTDARRTPDNPR